MALAGRSATGISPAEAQSQNSRGQKCVSRECSCVNSLPLGGGWHRKNLGGAQNLPKSLIFSEEKSPPGSVIDLGKQKRATDGCTKLITHERRDPASVHTIAVIEEIARIESRVTNKLKCSTMKI